jgi:antitoxin component of RelBE/YafQ-DinJ toxin-antitoxin module
LLVVCRHLAAVAYNLRHSSLWRLVRRKEQDLKTDFKAASVLERLGETLSDADLDYQVGEGIHEFIVRLGGLRHVVDFTDDLMEKKNDFDLSVVILVIVERASTQSLPVHFMVRNDNFEKVMQALKH